MVTVHESVSLCAARLASHRQARKAVQSTGQHGAAPLPICLPCQLRLHGRRFLSTTTATNYSLVGSLNKIPVALIGLVAFNVPWSSENLASILVGLLAGIIFVKAKQLPASATSAK